MSRISRKFNFLLILSVGISVIISSLTTTVFLLYKSETDMHSRNIIHIKGLSDNISGFLSQASALNYQLSQHPFIQNSILSAESDWGKRANLYMKTYNTERSPGGNSGDSFLLRTQEENDFIDLLFVQDHNGDQTIKSFNMLGRRGERWWYKKFMEDDNYSPFISKSYYSLTGNKPVASIFHPIFSGKNFIGIMGMDINFNNLQKVVEGYLHAPDMYAIVLDVEGVIIAHPDRNVIKEIYNLKKLTKRVLKDSEATILNEQGYHETEILSLDMPLEIPKIISSVLAGERGFRRDIILDKINCDIYYEPVILPGNIKQLNNYAVLLIHNKTNVTNISFIITICTFLFIILTTIFLFLLFQHLFQKNILIPLETLVESMSDDNINEHNNIELNTNDEFGLLATSYNNLRNNLTAANNKLQEKMIVLRESEEGYKTFADVGLALTTEKNIFKLLELILQEARQLSSADGGTLYIYNQEEESLQFRILHNNSLNLHEGGISEKVISLQDVPMYISGKPNYSNVCTYSALTGEIVNIPDVYEADGFDFSGTRDYDKSTGYHSKSMIVLPMKNKKGTLIGVIQLINALEVKTQKVIPFSILSASLIRSLAYQAAVALTNIQLNQDIVKLFYSFIESIASAIDEKSPFTGGHINRVVSISMLIANKINNINHGYFKDKFFSEDELEELRLAAWMHDIGKITTPEYLVNKATKLEIIGNRIELIEIRFLLIQELLKQKKEKKKIKELKEDLEFIHSCNHPAEYLDDDKIECLKKIAAKTYIYNEKKLPYLTETELNNLSIRKGTLTENERKKIENHVGTTRKILSKLPFPLRISKVSDYATMHHEKLDGTGYDLGLSGEDIPLQARIIAMSDILEALTAKDRPYRKPISLVNAIKIIEKMTNSHHLDPQIFKLLVDEKIFEIYENQELT